MELDALRYGLHRWSSAIGLVGSRRGRARVIRVLRKRSVPEVLVDLSWEARTPDKM